VSYCIRLGQCASSLALLIQLRQDTSDVVYIQQGLNMLLARSTRWDEHQAGQCVGLETNFVELGSNGVHIKIQEKWTPTKGFRKSFQILFSFGCHTQEGERLVVGIITYLVTCKQLYK